MRFPDSVFPLNTFRRMPRRCVGIVSPSSASHAVDSLDGVSRRADIAVRSPRRSR
jgi:hypothetical protein